MNTVYKHAAGQAASLCTGIRTREKTKKKPSTKHNMNTRTVEPWLSRLAQMSAGQTSNDVYDIFFNFIADDGAHHAFVVTADAIDMIISDLEELARKALAKRLEWRTDRKSPHASLPPMLTHATGFVVEESEPNDSFVGLRLVIHRGSRPPIHIPLGRESFLRFVDSLRNWGTESGSKPPH